MSELEKTAEEEKPAFAGGEILQCGATDYWAVGRTKEVRDQYPNLMIPSRLKSLEVRMQSSLNNIFWF